jgi:hypothetical protein
MPRSEEFFTARVYVPEQAALDANNTRCDDAYTALKAFAFPKDDVSAALCVLREVKVVTDDYLVNGVPISDDPEVVFLARPDPLEEEAVQANLDAIAAGFLACGRTILNNSADDAVSSRLAVLYLLKIQKEICDEGIVNAVPDSSLVLGAVNFNPSPATGLRLDRYNELSRAFKDLVRVIENNVGSIDLRTQTTLALQSILRRCEALIVASGEL